MTPSSTWASQLILNKNKITQVFDRDEFHFHFSFVFSFPRNFLSKHGELPNVCILVVWSSPIFPSTPGTEIDFLWTKHFDYKTISKLTKTHLKKSNKKVRTKLPQTLMMTWFIFFIFHEFQNQVNDFLMILLLFIYILDNYHPCIFLNI